MSKLLENIYRAINIGLVNEMKIVCDAMDINIHEVIDAASQNLLDLNLFILAQAWEDIVYLLILLFDMESKKHGVESRFIELAEIKTICLNG